MSIWAILLYAAIFAAALYLLYHFKAQAWYWHGLSIAAALGIGLMPAPVGWQGPTYDVLFGSVFLLLFIWGLGGFLTYGTRRPRHKQAQAGGR
jgi:hypothetical protein